MHISPSRQFLYYSNELTKREYKNWTPPTQSLYVYFHEFVDIAKELKKANNGSRAYFMVSKVLNILKSTQIFILIPESTCNIELFYSIRFFIRLRKHLDD